MKEDFVLRSKERRTLIDLDYFRNGGIEKRDYNNPRRRSKNLS